MSQKSGECRLRRLTNNVDNASAPIFLGSHQSIVRLLDCCILVAMRVLFWHSHFHFGLPLILIFYTSNRQGID